MLLKNNLFYRVVHSLPNYHQKNSKSPFEIGLLDPTTDESILALLASIHAIYGKFNKERHLHVPESHNIQKIVFSELVIDKSRHLKSVICSELTRL